MGVHIIAYRVSKIDYPADHKMEQYGLRDPEYRFAKLPDSEWDPLRLAGDRAFCASGLFVSQEFDGDYHYRPEDFSKAREWVSNQDLPAGNKDRLYRFLDLMETDESIWMYFSW